MANTIEKKLAAFLKKQRGDTTYRAFAKKLGITPSSLFRIEQCDQSITLNRLQQIMDRLKVDLVDIFGISKRH